MVAIFSQYFLMIPYVSWTITYFYTHLMKPKKWLKRPMLTLFLISVAVNILTANIKTYSATTGTNLLQIYMLLTSLCFFQERLSRKLSCFLIYDVALILIESFSANIFIFIRSLFNPSGITWSSISLMQSMGDVLIMSGINLLVGIIFFVKMTPLMKRSFTLLNIKIFLQLILTLLIPTFAQGLIIYQTENPQFPMLSSIYWILCLICYPIFLLGLRNIRKEEKQRLLKQNQLQFMKEQLQFSQDMEVEYRNLRKWNHDHENHLLSLIYLMDMEKFDEAKNYEPNIFS